MFFHSFTYSLVTRIDATRRVRAMPHESCRCVASLQRFDFNATSANEQCGVVRNATYSQQHPSPLRLLAPCPMRSRFIAASRFDAPCSNAASQRNVVATPMQQRPCGLFSLLYNNIQCM